MDIKKKLKKYKTEISAVALVAAGGSGPLTDLMNTIGLDWDMAFDLISTTDPGTLVFLAVAVGLYVSRSDVDPEVLEQAVIKVLAKKDEGA